MTPDAIRERRAFYQQRMEFFATKMRELQLGCMHEDHSRVARSDTGNWCRSDDRYWYDCSCTLCGKTWTEDQ